MITEHFGVHPRAISSEGRRKVAQSNAESTVTSACLGGGTAALYVTTSDELDDAAALVVRADEPVLVLRQDLLPPADLALLTTLLGVVVASVEPAFAAATKLC